MKWFLNKKISGKGFTLIEILVVISIIGILSSMLYVNFNDARDMSRNKIVLTDLNQARLDLAVYKAQNSRYPDTLDKLVPEYVAVNPKNGIEDKSPNESCEVQYVTDASGSYYKIRAYKCILAENPTEGIQSDDVMALCPSSCTGSACPSQNNPSFYQSVAVYSAGGECK